MAERMLKTAEILGDVTGDANFDRNQLHRVGAAHDPGRRRSIATLENPQPSFGQQWRQDRSAIE